jgi:hypothetical protein
MPLSNSRSMLLFLCCLSLFSIGGSSAFAMRRFGDVPLPPPRPQGIDPPVKNADKSIETNSGKVIEQPTEKKADQNTDQGTAKSGALLPPAESATDNVEKRTALLAKGDMVADTIPAIAGAGACGIAAPVLLKAVILSDGKKVTIVPPATLRASLASAVADWVREDLEPAFATDGDRLTSIEGTGGYECRDRNRLASGKLSEHAIGNALDMHVFVTAKGKHIPIAADADDTADADAFRALAKKTACVRFMTVLGPGSDSFHAEHLHVDLEARHSGAHLCQWDMPLMAKVAAPAH